MAKTTKTTSKNAPLCTENFIEQLKSGIRYTEALSIVELCHLWRITEVKYNELIETNEEFALAHRQGVVDYAAYWQGIIKGMANGKVKGNAAVIGIAIANIESINWVVRPDASVLAEETVRKIVIEMLPGKEEIKPESSPKVVKLVTTGESNV